MRRILETLSMFALVATGWFLVSPGFVSSGTSLRSASASDACTIQTQDNETLSTEAKEWTRAAASQLAFDAVGNILRRDFGENTKAEPGVELAKGLIGSVVDIEKNELVLVVDPALVSRTELLSKVQRTVDGQFGVRVAAGCHGSADLLKAGETIRGRDWHPQAESATYTSYLDPKTSTYRVTFAVEDKVVAEDLRAQLRDLVTIDYGGVARTNRASDGEPHWGGAGIGKDGDGIGNVCTSGFTVDTQSAGKAMVTAGHCFKNGDVVESGSEPYGTAQGEYDYPTFDMMLINASNQNYDDDLYHNPYYAENNPIDVNGGSNPSVGSHLCISGMKSLAVCNNEVISLDASLCDSDGCTNGLIRTEIAGVDPCIPGDSGAPMYFRNPAPAIIRGLLIGELYPANDPQHPTACFGEKVFGVENHLNVSVATSP